MLIPKTPGRIVMRFWDGMSGNLRGVVCVLTGAFILIVMAALVKHLGQNLPAFQVLFIRFLVGLIVITPVMWRLGFHTLRTKRPGAHAMRGFFGFMGNLCFFLALINMSIADTVTIQFSRPLIMVGIAAWILREQVTTTRGMVALVGFSGIVMITQPFGDGFQPWALVALGGTVFGTLVVLTIKLLSRTEGTMVIMFYFALFTTLYAAIPATFVWQTPTLIELILLFVAGVLGIVGQGLFTHGIRLGETSFVMPFDYMRIVYSFLLGFLFFAEVPGIWSLLGAGVIVASSLYLVRTEQADKAKKTPARDPARDAARNKDNG